MKNFSAKSKLLKSVSYATIAANAIYLCFSFSDWKLSLFLIMCVFVFAVLSSYVTSCEKQFTDLEDSLKLANTDINNLNQKLDELERDRINQKIKEMGIKIDS